MFLYYFELCYHSLLTLFFLELKQLHSSLLLLLLLLVVKVVILIIAIHGSHLCRFSKLPSYTSTIEIVI